MENRERRIILLQLYEKCNKIFKALKNRVKKISSVLLASFGRQVTREDISYTQKCTSMEDIEIYLSELELEYISFTEKFDFGILFGNIVGKIFVKKRDGEHMILSGKEIQKRMGKDMLAFSQVKCIRN